MFNLFRKEQYSHVVLRNYCFVPTKEVRNLTQTMNDLTITSRYDNNKQIPIYVNNEEWFGFPRYYLNNPLSLGEKVTDLRSDGSKIELTFNVKL